MKPIKLTIEGIRSFSDRAEIDFATVGKSGLFGIFGNTGSGKSTILDGIILALYGKLTGLEMQELVSTRSEKAYAALEFEISSEEGRKRYFVERYFTLKKDRSYGSARAEIYEVKGGEYFILAAQTGMVNEKVEEILGLGLNEFTKCIVLPQGEFAEFVSSTKSERVRIVEKLFDLGRFGERFNLKLKAKREECQNKINILEAQREPYKSATEEEIEKVEKEIEECNKDIKVANGIIAKIERKISENEKFYEIGKESEEVKKQIEKATQELNETDKIKVLVLKYDLAKKISDLSAEATKAEEEAQMCEKVFKAAEEEYEKRLIEKQKAESELKKCEEEGEEISGLEKTVAELGALEGDYIRVQTLKSELSALSLKILEEERVRERKMAEIEENQAEIDRLNSQITELSEDCDPAKAFDGVRNQALKEEFIKQSDYYAKRKEKIKAFEDDSPLYSEVSGEYSSRLSEYGKRLHDLSSEGGEDIASSVVRFGEANEKREKALALLKDLSEKRNAKTTRLSSSDANISSLKANINSKNEEVGAINAKFAKYSVKIENFKMFYEQCKYELEAYKRKVKSVNEVLKTISEKCIAADREATAKREAASLKREGANSTKGRLDEMLGGEIKSVGEAAEIIRAVGDPDGARRRIAKAEAELTALKDRAKQLDGQMLLFGGKCENTDELRLELAKEKEKLNFLSENLGKNKKNASDLSQNFEKRCIIEKDIEKETAKATMFGKLYEAVKDKKFIEFVAAEFLSDIAESARKTLLELSGGKYDVTYVDGLDGKDGFFVVDNLNGGVRRSVSSLSGGETFLVSLSLALSLSSEIYRKSKRPMEFFFLDEGFGTLDGDLVDTVIGSLFKLRNDNFTIGLISHLQEMKNRIEAQIIVCAANQTKGSSVKTVAP